MNVGEKICLYKEKLGHRSFSDFAKVANCSVSWLNETSKKSEIKQINDMNNLVNLCKYLEITIEELLKDDDLVQNNEQTIGTVDIENCDDIGFLISEIVLLLDREGVRIDGILLNDKAKQICRDSLDVVKTLTKQYL